MAEADEACTGVGRAGLGRLMAKRVTFRRAWERGRLVYNVGRATAGAPIEEAAASLEMSVEQFRAVLRDDPELADARRQGRVEFLRRVYAGLAEQAQEGKVGAAREILSRLGREMDDRPPVNFSALRVSQAAEALGVTRQTIHAWATAGAPQNGDRTYHLPRLIEWRARQLAAAGAEPTGGDRAATEHDLSRERLERLRLENAARRGEMLERDRVVAGLVMRAARLKAWAENKPESLMRDLQGLPPAAMAERIELEVETLLRGQMSVPEWLELPPAAAGLFERLLAMILGQRDGSPPGDEASGGEIENAATDGEADDEGR